MATTLKTKNSVTTTVVPTTLVQGELAVNITDKKMWVGNAASSPIQIVGAGATNRAGGSNTQVQYNSSGDLAGSANMTFSGTALTLANDASISGLTVGKGGGAVTYNAVFGASSIPSAATGAYNTAIGGTNALAALSTGQYNTAVGSYALSANTTALYNTGIGHQAGYSNTTGSITAVGTQVLFANTTGVNNVAVGGTDNSGVIPALRYNTTGSANTAIGGAALGNNTTASNNTAVGYQSLYANTTGDTLTAVGYRALDANTTGYNSTAVGNNALGANTTGIYNVAVGDIALFSNTTGSYNTAVGQQALYTQSGGTNNHNTAVGYQAGYLCTGDGSTFIGSGAGDSATSCSNTTIVGYQAGTLLTTGDLNTFIGRTAAEEASTGNNNTALGFDAGSGSSPFRITTESNRVVIGNNAVTNAYVQVAWTVTSDARDKTNIAPIVHGLDFVQQLNPVSYQFKASREDDTPHGNKRYGFLAQDILALEGNDPVIIDNEQTDHLKYQGEALVPVLVKAIQELKAEFDAYKSTHP